MTPKNTSLGQDLDQMVARLRQQRHLNSLLDSLANGDAGYAIMSIRDEMYPMAWDLETGEITDPSVN